jgi:hypothetical protein
MSALPPKADIVERDWDVRFVPIADISRFIRPLDQRGLCYKSSGRSSEQGMTSPAIANTANEDTTVRKIADEAFAAFNSGRHVAPFSTRYPAFSLDDAYRAAALAHNMRIAKGYTPLGRKLEGIALEGISLRFC